MLECVFNGDAARRVKGKHTIQDVKRVGVSVGEQGGKGLLGHERQVSHVFLGSGRADAAESLLVGSSKDVQNLVELVDIVPTLKERSAPEELCEDAPDRPNVNCM